MPFKPYNLRGEVGEVLPFKGVKAETSGSPGLSFSMKLDVLIDGACNTAGIVGLRGRVR